VAEEGERGVSGVGQRRFLAGRVALGVAVLLVACLLVAFVPSKPPVRMTFRGYERNNANNAFLARFRYTNLSSRQSFMVGDLPVQVFEDGRWRWTGRPRVLTQGLLGVPGIWEVGLPCPTNATWRAALVVQSSSRYDLLQRLSNFVVQKLHWHPPMTDFSGGPFVFSESIAPPVGDYLHYESPPRKPEPESPWE
jgi:hypothetical protein